MLNNDGNLPILVVFLVVTLFLSLLCCSIMGSIDSEKDEQSLKASLEARPTYKLNITMFNDNLASIVVIDGHEYIVISRGCRASGITHKANCKFCTDSKPIKEF